MRRIAVHSKNISQGLVQLIVRNTSTLVINEMINKDKRTGGKINNLVPAPFKKLRHTLLAAAMAQAVIAPGAQAALIFVDNEFDSSAGCTLREAVQAVNQRGLGTTGCSNSGGPFVNNLIDIIAFATGVNTITLSDIPLDVNHSMQIFGDGVTIQRDVALNDRLMTIDGGFNVELNGLTFSGGPVTGVTFGAVIYVKTANFIMTDGVIKDGGGSNGGGLFLDGARGTLINTTVTGNFATGTGGGIDIRNNSTLTLSNSTVFDNTSNNLGGGIALDGLSLPSTAVINTSTISGNSAGSGGGIHVQRQSNLTLNQSVIMGNSADNGGGGIRGNLDSNIKIVNSTVSGNSAGKWGGGVYSRNSPISIINSTVSNNTANLEGAGLYAFGSPSGGSPNFSLRNSIVANSFGSADCSVSISQISASRQNIIEDGSCGTAAISADPRLGPLADNGGLTLSHALLTNSPAISAGDNAVCAASPVNSVDQRDEPRSNPDETICDLGAFESPEGRADSSFFVIPTKNGKMVVIEL